MEQYLTNLRRHNYKTLAMFRTENHHLPVNGGWTIKSGQSGN